MPRFTEDALILSIAGGSALAGLLVFLLPGSAFPGGPSVPLPSGYPEGPPPGHTGGFGDPTCRSCHFDHPLNEPGGSLEVLGLPAGGYREGETYEVEVVLTRDEMERAGFQATARLAREGSAGAQAGAFPVTGDGVERVLHPETGVAYVQQTRAGSAPLPGEGEARWSFIWTAPEEGAGPVLFHVAANAGNDDASEFGDRIYADSMVVGERTSAPPKRSGEARSSRRAREPGSGAGKPTGRW